MKDLGNIIFYSINSSLANFINTKYYGNNHYVWIAPYFDCKDTNPSSSNPIDIYTSFKKDLRNGRVDYHSLNILNNRAGIKKGAVAMFNAKKIDEKTRDLIITLTEKAEHQHFKPLIYVIPKGNVMSRIEEPNFTTKANTLSMEYIIPDLKGGEFDIIEI